MQYTALSVIVVLISMLKVCTSFPADKAKPYKVIDPLPLFVLSLPMEVDEPGNTVENLPGKPSSENDQKPKRNGIFSDNSDACCPTVVEVIEPLGGKNRSGDLVELYQGVDGVRQRFYEVSCSPSIVDKHCRFLDRKHQHNSRCVQQYSYTYALVRDFGVDYDDSVNGGGWRLDYIQVRSGCSCKVNSSRHHNNGGSN